MANDAAEDLDSAVSISPDHTSMLATIMAGAPVYLAILVSGNKLASHRKFSQIPSSCEPGLSPTDGNKAKIDSE